MVKLKVGVYVDEKIWNEVKNLTFRKYGTLRELSREVNKMLKANLPLLALERGAELLGIEIRRVSAEDLRIKPKMRKSSVEIIREMRARA